MIEVQWSDPGSSGAVQVESNSIPVPSLHHGISDGTGPASASMFLHIALTVSMFLPWHPLLYITS